MARSRTALGLLALPGGLVLTTSLVDGGRRMLAGSTSAGADPAAAVAGLAAVLAALMAGWLTLCLALTLAAELPGVVGAGARELRDRVTPVVVRRWAAIVLGASVTATVVPGTAVAAVRAAVDPTPTPAPTAAATGGAGTPSPGWGSAPSPTSLPSPGFAPPTDRTPSSTGTRPPSPGWVPERPSTRYRGDPHLLTGRHRSGAGEESVAVRRGDTLWTIAATHLGPDATDAEIARAWPRWYAVNADAIGEDPHHLLPGTLLTPPADH